MNNLLLTLIILCSNISLASMQNSGRFIAFPKEPRSAMEKEVALGMTIQRTNLLPAPALRETIVELLAATNQVMDILDRLRKFQVLGRDMDLALNGQFVEIDRKFLRDAELYYPNGRYYSITKDIEYIAHLKKMYLGLTDLFAAEKKQLEKQLDEVASEIFSSDNMSDFQPQTSIEAEFAKQAMRMRLRILLNRSSEH